MNLRGEFSNRLGFIAAAAGSAVGLGNIWGFPYEVGQGGGGIFLIIYLFFCFTLCFPVMLTEVAIGRRTQKNAVGAFNALGHSEWNFIGKLGVLSGVLILSYYNVIAGWAFGYVFEMGLGNFCVAEEFVGYTSDIMKVGFYGLLFMIATSLVVSRGIAKGIEKLAKVLMPALILMIVGLSLYALTLPNALSGIRFHLVPDFSEINLKVIFNAMGQAFFSLSLGMGALITYGSYVRKNENLISAVTLITLADVGIAFLAGLMIFPFIGFMTGGTMSTVSSGPELIFVTLPKVFETIGGSLGTFIGATFFMLLCFAALTSTISLMEVPVAYLVDERGLSRPKSTIVMGFIIYLLGIPSLLGKGFSLYFTNFMRYPGSDHTIDFLSFVLNIANDSFLPLGGCLIMVFAAYVWRKENLDQEIMEGARGYGYSWLRQYMRIATLYIIPLILLGIFVTTILATFFGV